MRHRTILNVKNLTVCFRQPDGPVEAVRDVDYDIERGGILGIIGESGSGKTVSTSAILGLAGGSGFVSRGEAIYEGRDILSMDEKELREIRGREIAYVFQNPQNALNPNLKIGRQFQELIGHYGIEGGWREVEEVLRNVGIEDPETIRHMYAAQLSGGLCQRIAIAMGVLGKPKILVADEPTSSIDASLRRKILVLLKKVSIDYGMSIILITHDFDVARFLCDRIIVMYGGMVVEEGTVNHILEGARHPYTDELMRCANSLKMENDRLHTLEGHPPTPGEAAGRCPFYDRCGRRVGECGASVPALEIDGLRKLRCFNPLGEGME